MAEVATVTQAPTSGEKAAEKTPGAKRGPSIHQIYALPAPIRTFPLPAFYPNNPLSLFHVASAWIGQLFSPPAAEPAIVHNGVWSDVTMSVHITDEKSMRALWEQGFYGKGSLSRSEPNWLKREQVRRGLQDAHVSEILTVQRRQERAQAKWERARLEQEAIQQTRLEEAKLEREAREAEEARRAEEVRRAERAEKARLEQEARRAEEVRLEQEARRAQEAARLARLEQARQEEARRQAESVSLAPTPVVALAPVGPLQLLALPNSRHELLALSKPAPRVYDTAPVGPLQLLALPNSRHELLALSKPAPRVYATAPVGPLQLLSLPNSHVDLLAFSRSASLSITDSSSVNDMPNGHVIACNGEGDDDPFEQVLRNGSADSAAYSLTSIDSWDSPLKSLPSGQGQDVNASGILETIETSSVSTDGKSPRRHKSVRFSPKVESTTFQLSDPPSPSQSPASEKASRLHAVENGKSKDLDTLPSNLSTKLAESRGPVDEEPLVNKEHLQLTPEEAFFLSFGLGVLRVTEPESGQGLSNKQLFNRFRQHSYFPPRVGPEEPELQPDDGFLLHYAVYHHFRSLGWVPRAGIKFGVDWLLYTRGPVFDHAEFGIMVIPSYSDEWWKSQGKQGSRKTWAWLHNIVRVLSHVTKSLVLVYVDVPPPAKFEQALDVGVTEALKLYKVREVMVKRWSSNRNR